MAFLCVVERANEINRKSRQLAVDSELHPYFGDIYLEIEHGQTLVLTESCFRAYGAGHCFVDVWNRKETKQEQTVESPAGADETFMWF